MKYVFLVFAIVLSFQLKSQVDISFEFQAYPTGVIPGIRVENLHGDKSASHFRIGYNKFDHRDLGVQDEEIGDGFGFSLGYKRYFKSGHNGWHWGVKSDIWWNSVDWASLDGSTVTNSGTTKITVIQPTAEIGYLFDFENFFITPNIALGFEWNVKTDGEPTGEGAILLLGVQLGKRF